MPGLQEQPAGGVPFLIFVPSAKVRRCRWQGRAADATRGCFFGRNHRARVGKARSGNWESAAYLMHEIGGALPVRD